LGAENIPVFVGGATEAQTTAAIVNIKAGYEGLGGLDKSKLTGKIKEFRIVSSTGSNAISPKGADGKYVITFRETLTPIQIQGGLEFWISDGTITMMSPAREAIC
jgi:hypothetical protein